MINASDYLQLSDFLPVMKLVDTLYQDDEVNNIKFFILCSASLTRMLTIRYGIIFRY